MLPVNRASVLIAAALAVASPFVAGAMARARGGNGPVLLAWPDLLVDQLPPRIGSVLMMSGLVPLLLYFGAYLLACHAVRLLWRRLRRSRRAAA